MRWAQARPARPRLFQHWEPEFCYTLPFDLCPPLFKEHGPPGLRDAGRHGQTADALAQLPDAAIFHVGLKIVNRGDDDIS